MLTERPQPRAVAVDLKVRPVINDGRAIERKARGRHDRWIQDLTAQHLLDDVVDDSANAADGIVYPRVIPRRRFVFAGAVQCERTERTVAKPTEVILSEIGRGHDRSAGRLVAKNRVNALLQGRVEACSIESLCSAD